MQHTEKESQSWLKLSVILLFISILGFLMVLASNIEIVLKVDNPASMFVEKIKQGVGVVFLFVIPSIVFALVWTKAKARYLGITQLAPKPTFIIAGLGIVFAQPLINWLSIVNQKMVLPNFLAGVEQWMQRSEKQAEILTNAFTKGDTVDVLVLNLVVIALMAAFSEELFFRGVLQKVLLECVKNKHLAIWIGAILFSAFHMQFYGFVPRMIMGAYLGYLFLWTGSLWTSIWVHFLNNGTAVTLVWLANRGVIADTMEEVGAQDGDWLPVLMSVLLVSCCLFFVYKQRAVLVGGNEEDVN
jgi:uncharacterized protein